MSRPPAHLSSLLRSDIEGVGWPAVPTRHSASLLAQLYQFEHSQWWPAGQLADRQYEQLARLTHHAYRHSPFYRERFDAAGLTLGKVRSPDEFRSLPLLTRGELLTRAADIFSQQVPKSHGAISQVQTSGSTGQMVTVHRTMVNQLTWQALNLRDHLWHARDFRGTLAVIRAHSSVIDQEDHARRNGWGPPAALLCDTGPAYSQPISLAVNAQAEWLRRIDPHYLLTYPTNLTALLAHFEQAGQTLPHLREVRTISETLSADARERCRAVLGVGVVDLYSSQEVGVIALQCPESGLYHLQSESLLVEVLDDDGQPCRTGEVGRVIVTDLHNFATPIIRYEIRDYAEVGPPCPCGRGLPTLARILGRQRNMIALPDGTRHWPLVGFSKFRDIAPICQYQVIQHSLQEVEVRLVADEPLSPEQEAGLTQVIQSALGHPFPLSFRYFQGELPRTKGGKFEEVISHVI